MLVSAFPVYSFAAEGDVEINETNLPDESVRYVVKKADKDKNSVLSKLVIVQAKFSKADIKIMLLQTVSCKGWRRNRPLQ